MMPNTIADNLLRLQDARTAIATAITTKGGTVTTALSTGQMSRHLETLISQLSTQNIANKSLPIIKHSKKANINEDIERHD